MAEAEEKLQMKEIPSNDERRDSSDPNLNSNEKNGPDIPLYERIYHLYSNNYWVGAVTYTIFYFIYLFHFLVFFIFVGETAWPDADFCSTVGESRDEDTCKQSNGNLCDWNEWDNSNNVESNYCDSSTIYTIYQVLLLFYFAIVMIFWEGLSILSCFVTIVSQDRISKTPPKANIRPFAFAESGNNNSNNNNNSSNNKIKYNVANRLKFRIRYSWAYNIFLPIKWSILMGLSKCTKFDSFYYSLLASMHLDKINLGLEIGFKVLLNCIFAIWWIILNDNNRDVDDITICLFISSGLLLLQNCYEMGIIQTFKRKVYVLSSK